jgi:hypothetical protein
MSKPGCASGFGTKPLIFAKLSLAVLVVVLRFFWHSLSIGFLSG